MLHFWTVQCFRDTQTLILLNAPAFLIYFEKNIEHFISA